MGADYTEFQTGKFALDVHEVLPISITNVSGQFLQVLNVGAEAGDKALLQNKSQPAANTNILSSDLTPDFPPADFKLQVIMSNSGNFSVVITHGGNSQIGLLNGDSPVGITLIPGTLYTFDVLVHAGDSINFRYNNTGGTIQTLRVQEIDASSY